MVDHQFCGTKNMRDGKFKGRTSCTTENSSFAVCHRHSTKFKKYSAKYLPSVTLGNQHMTSTVPANRFLPSVFYRALGKDFAESWHRCSTKKVIWRSEDGYDAFAECQILGTRQTILLCRVSKFGHSAKLLPLPSVKVEALGKHSSFALCHAPGTGQSFCLCRVSKFRHSANTSQNAQNFVFFAECHSADTR